MKNNASLVYSFFLVIGDFLALVAAFTAAYILRVTLDTRPFIQISSGDYLKAFLSLLPFWLIIFGFLGLYNKNTYESRFSEFGRLLLGSFIGILLVIGYAYITDTDIFPARLVTVYGLLLALCFTLLFRTIARAVRRSLFSYGIGVNNVLIVGSTAITNELITAIGNTKLTGYRIVGLVNTKKNTHPHIASERIFSSFNQAITTLEQSSQVHSIIQTELYANAERNSEILEYAQKNHIAYRFVPGNSELFVGNIEVDLFHSIPVIAVHQTALIGWGRVVKRLFDLVVGGILMLLASPVMLLIAVLIKITDPGPVFYRQVRLSRYNSEVRIFKFRSMKKKYSGPLPEEAFTMMGRPELIKEYRENGDQLENDPRISRIGKFLRASSLDELPQIINVVKGDISLVGPRALVARDLDKYDKKNLILSVKSGMTGLAVISGRKDIPYEERRKLDLYYVQNWSFWGDIVILAKTASVVLFHRGAR
jgi:exopolysaccharide biosynthesis polyprenyl glycosylphosphotransferase